MARPIDLGLKLEGEDARRFHKYMENPDITEEGRLLIRKAVKLADQEPL
jgi:hypothetical protein